MYHILFQVSVYPIYFDPWVRQGNTFTNLIFCSRAAVKPRPSTENIYIKKSLSPPTELIFTSSATNFTMNFASV